MGNARNFAFWIVLFLLILALFNLFSNGQGSIASTAVSYSDFIEDVENGEVTKATLDGENVTYVGSGGTVYSTVVPRDADVSERLLAEGVNVEAKKQEQSGFLSLLSLLLPVIILIGFWFFMMNRMQGGGRGGAMGFGKSRAKLLTEREGRVTFDDVAGIDEAKEELQEIVEFLRNPQKFSRLGGQIPKGALLVGPPGTGKTLLARSVAGEAGVPFFTISGSDFVEMFVGVGASRVRDMFEQAKKNAPCIVFIDEIDAVGRHRGAGYGGGNDEREQTLNQLLTELDGFDPSEGVVLLAATNRPEILDPAEDLASYQEGCLSVPDVFADVDRPATCRVRYQDLEGETHEEDMEGLMATCIQHEMDHLEGILFIDHLSRLKRNMVLKKLKKLREAA